MGFGTSRAQARQIVRHGHIEVNGRKCNIPSSLVKIGDVVAVRERSKNNPTILAARDATAHAPAPNWMDVDREGLKGSITALPQRSELVQIQIERAAHRRVVLEVRRSEDRSQDQRWRTRASEF